LWIGIVEETLTPSYTHTHISMNFRMYTCVHLYTCVPRYACIETLTPSHRSDAVRSRAAADADAIYACAAPGIHV